MRITLLLLTLAASPLAAQGPTSRAAAQAASSDIKNTDLPLIARTLKSLRAEPATLTMHVGEVVQLGTIRVTAIDSAGRARGRLTGYDFSVSTAGPATVEPFKLTAVAPGKTELVIRFPRIGWKERTDPRVEARVKVTVVPK